jgi:prevent-host-death family protein
MSYGIAYAGNMKSISVTRARNELYRLLDEVSEECEPVQITGPRSNAVLISESDWRSIQETLYLLSVPGMRESIKEGMATPFEECATELEQ